MSATIRDVAQAAGVSIGTVSRVINGNAAVSTHSRNRVNSVVRSLKYSSLRRRRPVAGAPGLKDKRIGILFLGMDRSLSSLPVVATALQGVESVLASGGSSASL